MLIDRCSLEARLHELERTVEDPAHGLFGPRSQVWRVNRESAVFLGAGRALLLQLAHPCVAQAVTDHSPVKGDPLGRYYRTMRPVFAMVFGSLDQALGRARTVHRIHERITGTLPEAVGAFPQGHAYQAGEAHAALWVFATLWHTALLCHDLVLPALTCEERQRYCDEGRRFAALFGIPEALLPPDAPAFEAYMEAMIAGDALAVGRSGRDVADYFFRGGRGSFGRFVPRWYAALTARLLPERLRDAFALPYGPREQASARSALDRIGAVYPRLPGRLRFVGPYQEATARIAGASRPGPWARVMNTLWIGRRRLEP